jgi:hypothetical protein
MDEFVAIVEKIVLSGKHGPYVLVRSDELGSITFSLDKSVWQEKDLPDEGIYVMLSDLRKKRAGWRAEHGRFLRPSDQLSVSSTQQQARSTEQ